MSEMMTIGQQVLAAQGFSQLLGTELTQFTPELTELRLAIRPELLQQHGRVHGGVISYLADNALTFAGGAAIGVGVVTSEFKINYVAAAQGEVLIARATALHTTKRQAVCRCEVFAVANDTESLCAVAQGTIVRLFGKLNLPDE
jgi:uncharacterized protein (TIGR00369 family)